MDEETREHRTVERLGGRHVGQPAEEEGVAEQKSEQHAGLSAVGSLARSQGIGTNRQERPQSQQPAQSAAQHQGDGLEEEATFEEHVARGASLSQAERPVVAAHEVAPKAVERGLVAPRHRGRRPGGYREIGVGYEAEGTAENGERHPGRAQLASRDPKRAQKNRRPNKYESVVVSHAEAAGESQGEDLASRGRALDAQPEKERQGSERRVQSEHLGRGGVVPHQRVGSKQPRRQEAGCRPSGP